jgi:hypothetical protein
LDRIAAAAGLLKLMSVIKWEMMRGSASTTLSGMPQALSMVRPVATATLPARSRFVVECDANMKLAPHGDLLYDAI